MNTALLKNVCSITMGQAPAGSSYNESGEGFPLIAGAGDLGKITPKPNRYTTAASKISSVGDIILCIRATIGDRNWSDRSYCLGRGVAGLRVNPNELDSQYLWYWLDKAKHELIRQARGSTFKQVDKRSIENLEIPLPPIEEQRRIATILDKADSIRRKRQEAIRLTEELLRSQFLEMFGDPVTNPKGWEVKPLEELVKFVGGGTPSRKEPKYYEGSICWATSKDLDIDVLTDTKEHITLEAIKKSATKFVKTGCLLIVIKSKVLLKLLPIARTKVSTCFNQDLKAIIPHKVFMTRYLHKHIKFGQKILLQQARGVNTEGLTLEHLRNYKVMLPPASEIEQFQKLDSLLESKINKNKNFALESNNLFNSLLQRAFRGDL